MAYVRDGPRDRRPSKPREYTKAICADCGAECEVPFKPTQDRPVYCKECYKKHAPPRRNSRRSLY